MRKLTTLIAMAVMICIASTPALAHKDHEKPRIQIAILLDTSNSMDGLIQQAKSQLWKIINEFVMAKRNGMRPEIEVALYEYGNDSLPSKEGYIRQVLGFTSDLDKVSEKLFALTTNGGSEYCGQVIKVAHKQLDWSHANNDLKVMVIAGNEPFRQGPVDYRDSAKSAIKDGIIINTIHCGSYDEGVSGGWKDGAKLADGTYIHIDQDRAVAHIDAPQDKEIEKLGAKLNNTYIPYGAAGGDSMARQATEDSNAESVAPGSMVNRAVFKSSSHYKNAAWDLGDAVADGSVDLADVDDEALPAELKGKSKKEKEKYVAEKVEDRKKIQKKIAKLNEERREYVAKEEKKMAAEAGADSFDSALIKSVRTQASEKSFTFE
jgi:hypothetical protein